jgi:hypothetical protein
VRVCWTRTLRSRDRRLASETALDRKHSSTQQLRVRRILGWDIALDLQCTPCNDCNRLSRGGCWQYATTSTRSHVQVWDISPCQYRHHRSKIRVELAVCDSLSRSAGRAATRLARVLYAEIRHSFTLTSRLRLCDTSFGWQSLSCLEVHCVQ